MEVDRICLAFTSFRYIQASGWSMGLPVNYVSIWVLVIIEVIIKIRFGFVSGVIVRHGHDTTWYTDTTNSRKYIENKSIVYNVCLTRVSDMCLTQHGSTFKVFVLLRLLVESLCSIQCIPFRMTDVNLHSVLLYLSFSTSSTQTVTTYRRQIQVKPNSIHFLQLTHLHS